MVFGLQTRILAGLFRRGDKQLILPVVPPESAVAAEYLEYLEALRESNFSGDIEHSYSSRLAVATDNSIYQKMPQAVVYPKSVDDLALVGQLAATRPDIQFSARGGGTGTNGQSLRSEERRAGNECRSRWSP